MGLRNGLIDQPERQLLVVVAAGHGCAFGLLVIIVCRAATWHPGQPRYLGTGERSVRGRRALREGSVFEVCSDRAVASARGCAERVPRERSGTALVPRPQPVGAFLGHRLGCYAAGADSELTSNRYHSAISSSAGFRSGNVACRAAWLWFGSPACHPPSRRRVRLSPATLDPLLVSCQLVSLGNSVLVRSAQ